MPSIVSVKLNTYLFKGSRNRRMESSEQTLPLRSQRKRKRVSYSAEGITTSPPDSATQEKLLTLAKNVKNLVVFSGSGLSAGSGMSTFSTKGGLYERAQKRFAVADGKRLFTYNFYEKRKLETLAFFADIYAEARKAKPGPGHKALAQIAQAHKLLRHYTMNIDGLAEAAGMDAWHVETNPTGQTVEMHGNINQLVCPSCGIVVMITPALLKKLKGKKAIPCGKCDCQAMRCRIMLYDDADDDVITPEDIFDIMEEDVQKADLLLWVGISFEQSASTAYFRRVRQYLMEANRLEVAPQAIVNITEDALWNLMSACSNTGSLDVLEVLGSSDAILPMLAATMTDSEASQTSGSPSNAQLISFQPIPQAPDLQTAAARQHNAKRQLGRSQNTEHPPQQQQPDALQQRPPQTAAKSQKQKHAKRLAPVQQQPNVTWHQQHHMQTRRQLGHQVAQLQQLNGCQQHEQIPSEQDHFAGADLLQQQQQPEHPCQRTEQSETIQQPQQQALEPLLQQAPEHLQQQAPLQSQQQVPEGMQQQAPAQLLQNADEQPQQQVSLQSEQQVPEGVQRQAPAHLLQPVEEQLQQRGYDQAVGPQQHAGVEQVQQGIHAAQLALQKQVARPVQTADACQAGPEPQESDHRQGALSKQECRALTAAIKPSDLHAAQRIGHEEQQPLAVDQQPAQTEAELRLLKPTVPEPSPSGIAQELDLNDVLVVQAFGAPERHTLRVVEGQLTRNLDQQA